MGCLGILLFPRFRAGTFIEASSSTSVTDCYAAFPRLRAGIFAVVLNVNREVSRGLRSPVLETKLVFRLGLFSLKHEDVLDAVPTADSSCQLSESEMTKSDACNLQQRYGEIMNRVDCAVEERNRIMEMNTVALEIYVSHLCPRIRFVRAFIEVFDENLEEQARSLYLLSCVVNLRAFNVASPHKSGERLFCLMFVENLLELEMFIRLQALGLNAMVEASTGLEVTSSNLPKWL